LADDHKRAKVLSGILQNQSWVSKVVDVEANIVVLDLTRPSEQKSTIEKLNLLGVAVFGFGPGRIRFVTHLDISDDDINQCEEIFKKV
jgi:threonine aldolase